MCLKDDFKITTVADLFLEGGRAPFVPVSAQNDSALEAMIYLGKYGIHRVWPTDCDEIVNIITQRSMLELIYNNLSLFPDLVETEIENLGIDLKKQVFSVTVNETYWEAFRVMHENVRMYAPVRA